MNICRYIHLVTLLAVAVSGFLTGCGGPEREWSRTVQSVGAEKLRKEAMAACRDGFASRKSTKVQPEHLPESVRAFQPMGLWAEPDGAYLLLDSDAEGERGIFFPRIGDKDPECGPKHQHVKLAAGIYTYEKKR